MSRGNLTDQETRMYVPPFKETADTIKKVRLLSCSVWQEEGISPEAQVDRIMRFFKEHPHPDITADSLTMSHTSWREFLKEKVQRPNNRQFVKAAWYWLYSEFSHKLNEQSNYNPLFLAIYHQMQTASTPDPMAIEGLQGRYAVYRPYFWNPGKIMVSSLVCGGADDPTAFEMRMEYPRSESPDIAVGHVVPYGENVAFQGAFKTRTGPFFFVVRRVEQSNGRYISGEGILLAGAEGHNPSAYLILMMRNEGQIDVGVFLPTELVGIDDDNLEYIGRVCTRKIIDWK